MRSGVLGRRMHPLLRFHPHDQRLSMNLSVDFQCRCAGVLTSGGASSALEGCSMLSQLVQVPRRLPALHRVCARLCVGIHFRNFQAAAGRISVVAAAGINADCAADVVHACMPQSLQLPVAAPVWIHMSGSGLSPTAADPSLPYLPPPCTSCMRSRCRLRRWATLVRCI